MAEHNTLGQWGEQVVTDYLVAEGYSILERNWRMNHLELDLVVTKGNWIAFVEVKTRTDSSVRISDIITPRKISRIVAAANVYLSTLSVPLNPRFDVALVHGDQKSHVLEYIPDAFFPRLRTR